MKPRDEELIEFDKRNNDTYNHCIEARFLCNICYLYTYLDDLIGYIPEYHHLKCYQYYLGDYLEQYKQFKLIQNNGIAK